jgi:hypothetical protein
VFQLAIYSSPLFIAKSIYLENADITPTAQAEILRPVSRFADAINKEAACQLTKRKEVFILLIFIENFRRLVCEIGAQTKAHRQILMQICSTKFLRAPFLSGMHKFCTFIPDLSTYELPA